MPFQNILFQPTLVLWLCFVLFVLVVLLVLLRLGNRWGCRLGSRLSRRRRGWSGGRRSHGPGCGRRWRRRDRPDDRRRRRSCRWRRLWRGIGPGSRRGHVWLGGWFWSRGRDRLRNGPCHRLIHGRRSGSGRWRRGLRRNGPCNRLNDLIPNRRCCGRGNRSGPGPRDRRAFWQGPRLQEAEQRRCGPAEA